MAPYKNVQEYLDSLTPVPVTPETVVTTAGTVDVTDRSARKLGVITGQVSITNPAVPVVQSHLSSALYSPDLDVNVGVDDSRVIKASAGNLFSFATYNSSGLTQFVQFYDLDSLAGIGFANPIVQFTLFSKTQVVIGTDFFSQAGLRFSTGITFGWSTTTGTFVAGTASDQLTSVIFK